MIIYIYMFIVRILIIQYFPHPRYITNFVLQDEQTTIKEITYQIYESLVILLLIYK